VAPHSGSWAGLLETDNDDVTTATGKLQGNVSNGLWALLFNWQLQESPNLPHVMPGLS